MALFKALKGSRAALTSQPLHEGYAYFCVDDGSFHIDVLDADGNLVRKQINAKNAETVMGMTLEELVETVTAEIDTDHNHDDKYYTETEIDDFLSNKQDILTGTEGQVVQINSDGQAVSADLNLIAVEDIDTICGGSIQYAEDVMF